MQEEVRGNNWEGQRQSLVALLGAFHSTIPAWLLRNSPGSGACGVTGVWSFPKSLLCLPYPRWLLFSPCLAFLSGLLVVLPLF